MFMVHYTVAKTLVLIGALNWGFVGITILLSDYFGIGRRFDPVEYIGVDLLGIPAISIAVYILIGFAAVIVLVTVSDRRGLRDTV